MPTVPSDPFGPASAGATQGSARAAAWERALEDGALPHFVTSRLAAAADKRIPWLATMSPAELLLTRRYGFEPVATVSGTCWYNYGYSWTKGHAEGWHLALERLRREAVAAGANAVVDVKMRTTRANVDDRDAQNSMDYSMVGTAVRFSALPANPEPVIATVSAIEFIRLLEAGIVATGVAVGAHYEWLTPSMMAVSDWNSGMNGRSRELTEFWEWVRRQAIEDLKRDTAALGSGVLAHTHFGELIRIENQTQPVRVLGRHIVIGTIVECRRGDRVPHAITSVVDLRDELSPLRGGEARPTGVYPAEMEGGGI